MSAVEKAVAVMERIDGPMSEPCRVCRGGWWYENGVVIAAVHANRCPDVDKRAAASSSRPGKEPAA